MRSLSNAAARAGIDCQIADLGAGAAAGQIQAELARLSADPAVHGIILQAPVPAGAAAAELAGAIDPAKDVDGRSAVVGKPAALLLLARHATVTICHSRTPDLGAVTSQAEVLVVAAGRPGLITAAHVQPGAVVVDAGTSAAADGGLVGDVDPVVEGLRARCLRCRATSAR